MYAFAIAASQAPGGPIRFDLHPELMLQPPWSAQLKADVSGWQLGALRSSDALLFPAAMAGASLLHAPPIVSLLFSVVALTQRLSCPPLCRIQNGLDAFVIHFTYGQDFDERGEFSPGKVGAWHWDKRDWIVSAPAVLRLLCCAVPDVLRALRRLFLHAWGMLCSAERPFRQKR